jgi:hypothetical protein
LVAAILQPLKQDDITAWAWQVADSFARLDEKQRSTLLQIIFKRIIVSPSGEIINYELNSPFATIYKIAVPPKQKRRSHIKCSEQICSGPPNKKATG